jgi:PLP dependent protein
VLEQNLEMVERRICAAAERAGRSRDEITLVAVTKKFPASVIRDAYALGVRHFGENYVQEFEEKSPVLSDLAEANFHLIGHLQSNKARRAAELFRTVETVDSPKLAARLDAAGKQIDVMPIDVMIEVKLSEEEAKAGAAPEEIASIVAAVREAKNLRLLGLMTMPPWTEDAELSRPYFRRLRELAREHGLAALSMGMSNDFEVGIEEGATHVRVGTALFGKRKKE